MTDTDHEQLLDVLLKHRGSVMVSGYESGLYNDALHGWNKETKESYTQSMKKKTEVVWMNFEPSAQGNLFGCMPG